jgi:hypothetical protein
MEKTDCALPFFVHAAAQTLYRKFYCSSFHYGILPARELRMDAIQAQT